MAFSVGEDIGGIVFVFGYREKCDRASHQDENVEDDIAFGHLLHPVGGQRVDEAVEDSQSSHHTYRLVVCWYIGKVRAHGDSGEQDLCRSILRRGDTGDLTKQVEPAVNPRDGRDIFAWGKSRDGVIQTAASGIG